MITLTSYTMKAPLLKQATVIACISFFFLFNLMSSYCFALPVRQECSHPTDLASGKSVAVYRLDLSKGENRKVEAWLKAGASRPNGDLLGVNSLYWTKDGKPWLPIMGEFHYARFPHSGWEEQILKMKAAGFSIISTYVFWVNSENPQGVWNWTGDNDLRQFIKLCQKHGLYVWLRPGPYINAEAKNGGLPEWANKPGRRSNAPWYMTLVTEYYKQVANQTRGLFYKDGGPIIGLQVDNEFASGDIKHLSSLLALAQSDGMVAPFNTCTSNSKYEYEKGDLIPLQGAYPYRGWTGPDPSSDFLFSSDEWNAMQNIGGLPYDGEKFPRGMAELGVACWQGYDQRFIVPAYDSEGHLQNCVGRGINLVGYYMFQGGTQKAGFEGDGHPLTYDFQAPLGEYGQVRPSYHNLKLIHSFLNDFGSDLATMQPVRPNPMVLNPTNTDSLRYVGRFNGNRGFLFMTTTQAWVKMRDMQNVQVRIKMGKDSLLFPREPFTLKANTSPIFPINLDLNGATLRYSTAQLLCKVNNKGVPYYFFFQVDGVRPEFVIENSTVKTLNATCSRTTDGGFSVIHPTAGLGEAFSVIAKDGAKAVVVLLTRKQAEQSWRFNFKGEDRLLISNANLLVDGSVLEISSKERNVELFSFPSLRGLNLKTKGMKGIFGCYTHAFANASLPVEVSNVSAKEWTARVSHLPKGVKDIFLNVSYFGSVGEVLVDGVKYSDDRFNGKLWDVGIKRFIDGKPHVLTFRAKPWDVAVKGVAPELMPRDPKDLEGVIRSVVPVGEYFIRVR